MARKRILYLLRRYPQISETYVETELRHVWDRYDVKVIALGPADSPRKSHKPYELIPAEDKERLANAILAFAPDVVHGHYIHHAPLLQEAGRIAKAPYTVRAHSYDVLNADRDVQALSAALNDDACLGVLTFPFTRERLVGSGVRAEKVHDCYPVVDYARFHDESPNGGAVMNVGACLPKKNHEFYLELAAARRNGRAFHLYAMGYNVEQIRAENAGLGSPVNVMPLFEHEEMPAQYKQHQWLVYTASPEIPTVGWPMAIAEAQAAGVGVCMQNIRPDLEEYVGPAGFMFRTLDEVLDIVSQPFPDDMRRLGFEHARRSDVASHIGKLEQLWERC